MNKNKKIMGAKKKIKIDTEKLDKKDSHIVYIDQ